MFAKCIATNLPIEKVPFGKKGRAESLTVGCYYVIYGAGAIQGIPTYLVTHDDYNWFPRYTSAYCFDPPVGSFPGGMVLEYSRSIVQNHFMVCQKEFHTDSDFPEVPTEGDVAARKLWLNFKSLSEVRALEEIMKSENPEKVVALLKIQLEKFPPPPMD